MIARAITNDLEGNFRNGFEGDNAHGLPVWVGCKWRYETRLNKGGRSKVIAMGNVSR